MGNDATNITNKRRVKHAKHAGGVVLLQQWTCFTIVCNVQISTLSWWCTKSDFCTMYALSPIVRFGCVPKPDRQEEMEPYFQRFACHSSWCHQAYCSSTASGPKTRHCRSNRTYDSWDPTTPWRWELFADTTAMPKKKLQGHWIMHQSQWQCMETKLGNRIRRLGEREATWILTCLLGNPYKYHEKPSFVTLASWGGRPVDLTLFHLDGLAINRAGPPSRPCLIQPMANLRPLSTFGGDFTLFKFFISWLRHGSETAEYSATHTVWWFRNPVAVEVGSWPSHDFAKPVARRHVWLRHRAWRYPRSGMWSFEVAVAVSLVEVLPEVKHDVLIETFGGKYVDVSENSGFSPQIIPCLIGFSIIFTIHFGGFPPIFGNTYVGNTGDGSEIRQTHQVDMVITSHHLTGLYYTSQLVVWNFFQQQYGIVRVSFFFGRIQESAPRSRQAGIRVVCIPNRAHTVIFDVACLIYRSPSFPQVKPKHHVSMDF